jgi:hemolysin-activating ACP:hemolysin acyltransferase
MTMSGHDAGLRLFRPQNPATALGLAVSHLMTRTPFAQMPMGPWCRILVGQINRGHYQLVLDRRNRVTGFLGWAIAGEAEAEAWLRGRAMSDAVGAAGDCIVFNAWAAEDAAVNRCVLGAARVAMQGLRMIYSKRYYRDGRIRPLRLAVNDFVERHIDRAA